MEIATFPGRGTAIWSGKTKVKWPPGTGFRAKNHGKTIGFSIIFRPETLLFPLQMASRPASDDQKTWKNKAQMVTILIKNLGKTKVSGLAPPKPGHDIFRGMLNANRDGVANKWENQGFSQRISSPANS